MASLLSVAILPIGMISIIQTVHLSGEAERAAESALRGRTETAAAGERALLLGALGTADALGPAVLEAIDTPAECSAVMRGFVQRSATFVYAGFTALDGKTWCSSSAEEGPIDFSGSPAFESFKRNPVTSIMSLNVGRVSKQSVVVVQQPLYRDRDMLGYVSVSLSTELLRSTHSEIFHTDGAKILTFNNKGQILSTETGGDEHAIDILPKGETFQSLLMLTDTSFSGVSNSGQDRIFSVVPVVPGLVYALGSWNPSEAGIQGYRLTKMNAILFPALLWIVSLAVAYFAVYRLVLRHISELRGQMRRFAVGDRTAMPRILKEAPAEIADVSRTFHNMARILRRDEIALAAALDEKTVLLKEVHHRVKNNLQLIASIINMQIRVVGDVEARRILRSVQARVSSLATIYRNLYQAEHLDSVNANELLTDVVTHMSAASIAPGRKIKVRTEFEPIVLEPDQAIPLTLLATEAFTNALKYAGSRDDIEPAQVTAILKRSDEGSAIFEITNTISHTLPEPESTGLGRQLIEAFAMQLDGETHTEKSGDQFSFVFSFDIPEPDPLQRAEARNVVLTSAAKGGARH